MEIIRKKICLDDYRSRVLGVLPFFDFNGNENVIKEMGPNGNYGGFPVNPYVNDEYVDYFEIMRKYHFIMDEYMNGVKLKRIMKKNGETWITDFPDRKIIYDFLPYNIDDFFVDSGTVYKHKDNEKIGVDFIILVNNPEKIIEYGGIEYVKWVHENIIGLVYLPSNIKCKLKASNIPYFQGIACPIPGIKMPDYVYYINIDYELDKMNEMGMSSDPCILKEWEELGGTEYINFLNSVKESDGYKNRGKLFVEDIIKEDEEPRIPKHVPLLNMNILLSHEYNELGVMSANEIDEMPFNFEPFKQHENIDYQVESKLLTLRSRDFFTDDDGNYLPGIFQEYDPYTEIREMFPRGTNVAYEVYTLNECVPDDYNGGVMIKYKNSKDYPMLIPYEINKPVNVYSKKRLIPKVKIDVEPNGWLFDFNGGGKTFIINSNYPWTASSKENWFSFSPNHGYGKGNETLKVEVDRADMSGRSGLITFICGEGDNSVEYTCNITQKPKEGYIELISGDISYTVDASEQSIYIKFKTNDSWVITSDDWIDVNKKSGNSGDNIEIKITINKNTLSYIRNGNIKISLVNSTKFCAINVKQRFEGSGEGSGDNEGIRTFNITLQNPIYVAGDIRLGDINASGDETSDGGGWEFDGKEEFNTKMRRYRPIDFIIYYSTEIVGFESYHYATISTEYIYNNNATDDMLLNVQGTWDLDSEYFTVDVPQNIKELKIKFLNENDGDFDTSFIGGGTCKLSNAVYNNGEYEIKWPLITIYSKNK